jgi:hypothetical protein
MVVNHGTLHLTIHQEKWGDATINISAIGSQLGSSPLASCKGSNISYCAWAGKSTIEFGDFPITGWWFQTFFIFHNIWDNPSH